MYDPRPRLRPNYALLLFAVGLCSCGGGSGGSTAATVLPPIVCTGFGDWQQSAFVLPYTVGEPYRVNQGNCSGFGHSGFWLYSHLTLNGVHVTIGQAVQAGGVIGQSGNTGNTGGLLADRFYQASAF